MKAKPTKQQYNVRLEPGLAEELDKIASQESEKTGYKISRAELINKIMKDFIRDYK